MKYLREVKRLLHTYDIRPKRKLGQSFVVSSSLINRLVAYADVSKDDIILEVGAGLGFLTEEIAKKAGKVIAVEIDRRLVKVLRDRLGNYDNIVIVEGNILKMELPYFDKVLSNPPYLISSPLIFKLLTFDFKVGVFTFQEEFARRLAAPPGTHDYSRLTVMVCYHAKVELLETIPRTAFYPPPKISSVIVRLMPRKKVPFKVVDLSLFSDVVRILFSQRRRTLRKALRAFCKEMRIEKTECIEVIKGKLPLEKRVYEITPEEFGIISNEIAQRRLI